ncbi:MAG: dimethylarginine dimethylaminohydrolase family protein [Gemmatimonadales bacterium]
MTRQLTPSIALLREVSPTLDRCELTHLAREPVDPARARAEHHQYAELLAQLGCQIRWVPPAPELPDAVFIEDTAVVVDEVAVVTRPGAPSRQPETVAVAVALRDYRPVLTIYAPGTLDGGDVLRVGRTLYVGRSARTNAEGAAQLARHLAPYGYVVRPVEARGCLHLKTAVTEVAEGILLCNPAWVDRHAFGDLTLLEVDPAESFAANALRIGAVVLHAAAWPRTRERLEHRGIRTVPIDVSELAKAEGGVTCCSVILRAEVAESREAA